MKSKVLLVLGTVGFLGIWGLIGNYEATYSRLAICSAHKGSVWVFTDNSGNDWEWEGDYFEIGNAYRLIMDTLHTDSYIYDDQIKKIKNF